MKKVKVCIVFLLKLMWFTRNDLAQGLQTFCPRTRWGSTEHVEGLTSYILWLFRGMPYSPKSTNFRKYIFSSMTKFFADRSLEAPDLATVSYAFCCWLQISLTMSNLSFRVRRELSTELATKGSRQNHMAISHCCQAGNQGRSKGDVSLSNVELHILNHWEKLSWPRAANQSFHQAVDSWYFAAVSALELTAE